MVRTFGGTIMLDKTYKYDVAISFLANDLPIATRLKDLLQERLEVFVYTERQLELAGTEGHASFAEVFGNDARSVVVLYRSGWGEKGWTRPERTAIQNRAQDEGYDFVVMIPLDEPPVAPKWFPKNFLWVGWKEYGERSAAAVIEARATQLGSNVRAENIADRAARSQRHIADAKAREQFAMSYEGIQAAKSEFLELRRHFEKLASELAASPGSLQIKISADREAIIVEAGVVGMWIDLSDPYANRLHSAALEVLFFKGRVPRTGDMYFDPQPRPFAKMKYSMTGGDSLGFRWFEKGFEERSFSTSNQAENLMRILFDHADAVAAKAARS